MSAAVGVDIGGTKTRLALLQGDSDDVVRDEVIASSSWRGALGDPAADARGLSELLVGVLGEGVRAVPLAVGAHGCDSTAQCLNLERELGRLWRGPVRVVNDSELMAPAMEAGRAIGLVVGTGSIATARTEQGELITAGGWGWLIGDEGSAPGVVRDAVRAVLAERDRGATADPLGAALLAAFDAVDGPELALALTDTASAESWGAHAPVVFAVADEGSALAKAVIDAAGEALAVLVGQLLDRGVAASTVVAGGSVIEKQPRMRAALHDALSRTRRGITLQVLDRPPVRGALALARTLAPASTPIRIGESHS